MGRFQVKFWAVAVPLLLSIAGFVLAMLALFAGTGPRAYDMEDYHIIALNMSYFGHDLVPSPTSSSAPQPTETDDGGFFDDLLDDAEETFDDLQTQIVDELNDQIGNIADELSEALGISQWYGIHLMNWCEGDFTPNATEPNAAYNTTNCTAREAGISLNLTEILDRELSLGPLSLNAADIQLPEKIQETIDYANQALLAVFILYVIGSGLSGLSVLLCLVTLALAVFKRHSWDNKGRYQGHKKTVIGHALLSFLAAVALAAGSALTTAVAKKGETEITEAGEEVGISATAGTKFMAISWSAFAVMFVTFIFWVAHCCGPRRKSSAAAAKDAEGRASYSSGYRTYH